jgi:hypothetical protein
LVLIDQLAAERVKEVVSPVCNASVQTRYSAFLLLPVLAPLLFAREAALRFAKAIQVVAEVLQVAALEAARGDDHISDAEVNAVMPRSMPTA